MISRTTWIAFFSIAIAISSAAVLPADDGAEGPPYAKAADPMNPTYQGLTFDDWVTQFKSELDPARRCRSLKALVVFGTNGKAEQVVPLILETLDSYNLRPALMLVEGFDESSKELQGPLAKGRLPDGFETLGFTDVDDLKLFLAANRGLGRLSSRAAPVLVKHLEQPGELTASRIAAMRALAMGSGEEWMRLVPKLAARDNLSAMIALNWWGDDELAQSADGYETCLKEMLQLKPGIPLIAVVRTLGESKHSGHHKEIVPLLEELLKNSTDENVREAVKQTLAKIPTKAKQVEPIQKNADGLTPLLQSPEARAIEKSLGYE